MERQGKTMKEYVKVKELFKEVDAMAKRGGVTQEDLAMQIRGLIVHVAMKEETE